MMSEQTRILIVEDREADFDLARLEISKLVQECTFRRVETRQDFLDALETFRPDVILSDFHLPRLDGMTALKLAKNQAPLTPFIIWTGSLSEDVAVECMKAGASNYVLKDNPKRLGTAVVRSIEERRLLLERRQGEEKLRRSEARFVTIFENSPIAIGISRLSDGKIIHVNAAFENFYGYPREEMLGRTTAELGIWADPDDRQNFIKQLQAKKHIRGFEVIARLRSGEERSVIVSGELVDIDGELCVTAQTLDITERKLAEQKSHESEERFRSLIENSLDNISLLAADGTLLWENPAANRTLGYEQDEFVERNIFELMHPDDMSWTGYLFAAVAREPGNQQRGTFRLKHQDGTWRWIEATATNMLNEPSVGTIVINYRDVTERKLAEIKVQQRNDDLQLINAINEMALRSEGLDEIVNLLAKELKRNFSATGNTLYMLSPDGSTLTMQHYSLSPHIARRIEKIIGSTIPLIQLPVQEGSFFQKILTSQHGSITSDRGKIEKWMMEFINTPFLPPVAKSTLRKLIPQIYDLLNIRSTIAIPLLLNGKTIGLLDVSSDGLFTEDDLQRIENISRQLTAAIQRQQANEQIRRSEAFLQSIQNALSASIAILNEEGVIIQVNAAWRKFGEQNGLLHPEHCIGLNYLDICDTATAVGVEEATRTARLIREMIAGKRQEAQVEYACHSPEEKRWFTLRITKFDDGDHIWVVLAHENITERKLAEDAVKETSEQFRTLFEASPEGIILIDPDDDWNIIDCNEATCVMNGYKRDELIGHSIDMLILAPGGQEGRLEYLESVREAGILRYDDYHRRKDGTIFPIAVSTSLITLGGREMVLGIDRDITERKKAEDALQRAEKQLELFFSQSLDGFFFMMLDEPVYWNNTIDKDKTLDQVFEHQHITRINRAMLEQYRVSEKQFLGKTPAELFAHDLAQGRQTWRQLFDQGRLHVETNERRLDGTELWIEGDYICIYDDEGLITGHFGVQRDITERKAAEEEARKANEKYRNIFENALEAIHQTTPDGRYLTANPAAARILGYESAEALIMDVTDLDRQFYVDKDRRKTFKAQMEEYGFVSGFESEIYRKDGSTIWISESVRSIYDEAGNLLYYEGTTQEITERKKAEAAEREQRTLAEALRETAETLNSTLEYGEVLDHILAAAGRVVPHDAGTIMLIEEDFAHVVRLHGYDERGLKNEIRGVKLALAETDNLRQMLETRRPVIVNDTHSYMGWKRLPITDWLRSNVGAPISIYGEVIGFILLDSQTIGFFTPVHAERLEAFANQAALAIHNARLLQQAQEEITERRQVEEALRDSEEKYRLLFESNPLPMWIYDLETLRFLKVNSSAIEHYGYTENEFMAMTIKDIRPPVDVPKLINNISQVGGGIDRAGIWNHIKKDGSLIEVEIISHIVEFDGRRAELVLANDITERKLAENELRASEERFHQLADNIQEAFWITDAVTGTDLYLSPAYESIWGRPPEMQYQDSRAFIDSILPEDRPLVNQMLEIQRKGKNTEMEYRITRPDGSVRWIWDRAFPIYDESGKVIRLAGIAADITERKQAENTLRESEEQFRSLFDRMLDGVYRSTHAGRFVDVNPAMIRMFGYSSKDEMLNLDIKKELYFAPDERGSHILDTGQEETDIYRMRRKDGSEIWVEDHGSYIHDKDGNILYHEGILRDVTERKQSEDQLRESEERFSSAFEFAPIGMALVSLEGRWLRVNQAVCELVGYLAKELLEKNFQDISHPDDLNTDLDYVNRMLAGDIDNYQIEKRYIHKLGHIVWAQLSVSLVRDNQGKSKYFISQIQDITERRQAEEALRKNEQRLRIALAGTNIAVFNQDTDLRYTWIYQPQLGYISEQVIGKTDAELLPIQDALNIMEIKRRAMETGKPQRAEVTIHSADQTTYYYDLIAEPLLDSKGTIVGLTGSTLDTTAHKSSEIEIRRHLAELEALYENGLALGQLLDPQDVGERIITTFARHLSWHHVAIRLLRPGSDDLELIALSQPGISDEEKTNTEYRFQSMVSKMGQGLSGWTVKTGEPLRTGDVHAHPQYVDTHPGIRSGLYMPLKIGDRILGVISVESEEPDAFTVQDERLLATLANQAAVAFENARLYQTNQQERERFSELFENTPVATWLEDFSAVVAWMDGLRIQGIIDLKKYLENNPEQCKLGVSLIDIVDVNHAAIVMNGARNKEELVEKVHGLLMDDTPSPIMINELDLIWKGYTSFGFEMSSQKLDGSVITGIQRIYIPTTNNVPDYRRVIVTSTDITERVGFEQQLRASEIHYRELADSITDIFFELDQNLHYSHWNKASEMLTGLSAKNAIGKTTGEVFGESEDQNRIEQIYKEVLEKHHPRTFQTTFLINKLPRNFEINAYPSTRGVAVVAKDVTERKRSESLMQKRFELMEYSAEHGLEELMQKALDELSEWTHSTIGFFQLIKEDQITPGIQVWSTDTFSNFYSAEVKGMHKPADQAGVWAEAIRQRRAVIHNDYESVPGKKGLPEGHVLLIRELVVPIIRNERIVAVIGIGNKSQEYNRDDLEITERFADYAWDIIERKQMVIEIAEERNQLARRVEERTSDLSRANSNLARALRVKDEFLANMSHELRTPLNAILGLSESLSEQTAGPLNDKQQKYLTTISESGHHLLSLINDILDLAKIEAGQITLDIHKVDVNSVSQASLRMIRQLAQKKNIEISVEIDKKVGLMWADERRLKQMMVNLLSNAVKFTPEDGKIGLQIDGDQDDNKVEITVWDTGIGIKEVDFERLFQPFVQLDSGLARESSGTGLGLALVAQMARLHGGSVTVQSHASEGSRFTIILPWEPALAADAVERMKVTGKFNAIRPGHTQETILLIEDTQEVVMMIKDYLEIAGYKVATAQDGIDGITQAKFTHPDLILMDIQMPRMDGLEATKKLRQDPEFKYTPIIALTALAMPNDRERCIAAGMDEYISKPINLRALVKLIQNYLSLREEKTQPR